MPHLQFELSIAVAPEAARDFTTWATDRYADVMETGTGHVAVTIRDEATVDMGRAGRDEPVALLNADVRAGRSVDQREAYAMAVIDEFEARWAIPPDNTYVIYTEHPGEDFLMAEGALDSWSASEGP